MSQKTHKKIFKIIVVIAGVALLAGTFIPFFVYL